MHLPQVCFLLDEQLYEMSNRIIELEDNLSRAEQKYRDKEEEVTGRPSVCKSLLAASFFLKIVRSKG